MCTQTQTKHLRETSRSALYLSHGDRARAVCLKVLTKRSSEKERDCEWTRKPIPVYVASLLRREGQTETCRLQIFTHSNLCCCHVLGSSALVSPGSYLWLHVWVGHEGNRGPVLPVPARVCPADHWPWILSTRLWSCIFLPVSCQLSWLLRPSSRKNCSDKYIKLAYLFKIVVARCGLTTGTCWLCFWKQQL